MTINENTVIKASGARPEIPGAALETKLVQAGSRTDTLYGSINTPIYLSTTFSHPEYGASTGYDYTRTANPTRLALEEVFADIEGGAGAVATASGMSAVQLAVELAVVGKTIVTSRDLYGGTFRWFDVLEQKGVYKFAYADSEDEFVGLIDEDTTLVFIESPTNPLMNQVSIERISARAHEVGAVVVVDNTFFTPYYQKPLELGADVVIHSATKYLSGHNDVLGGAAIAKTPELFDKLTFALNTTGPVLGPFESFLVLRGLKTFTLRMDRHTENAERVVSWLARNGKVLDVFYAGKTGMISFKIGDAAKVPTFLNALNLVTYAESLGGVETLITYPSEQTHADIPEADRIAYGLTNDLLRMSIGLENSEDILVDLENAFNAI
ncbi:MAG: PLP-dependent transferase [Lactobacillales bacterium]|jgi:cystathionine gamma-synthase|nr:PLP-dependent transferase [Lactobacillales bacterium]